MGRHVGPSNSGHLRRMSDPSRGPWLTLNAAPVAKNTEALKRWKELNDAGQQAARALAN